jgi:hypothetical protein
MALAKRLKASLAFIIAIVSTQAHSQGLFVLSSSLISALVQGNGSPNMVPCYREAHRLLPPMTLGVSLPATLLFLHSPAFACADAT